VKINYRIIFRHFLVLVGLILFFFFPELFYIFIRHKSTQNYDFSFFTDITPSERIMMVLMMFGFYLCGYGLFRLIKKFNKLARRE